jgi:16S rRNA (cytosine967-C5)-methyltransferase
MFVESYFQVAAHLFEQYALQMPLHLFLKAYFKNNKKYGSRDRKFIAELLYGAYRIGKGNEHLSIRQKMLIGSFLANRLPNIFFEKAEPTLAPQLHLTLKDKLLFLKTTFNFQIDIPFALSKNVTADAFIQNMFSQPMVFIRIRKNKQAIEQTLAKHDIEFVQISDDCLSVSNAVKLDDMLNHEDYVIQDWASQQVSNFLHPQSKQNWWDACCASGGKSILLLDKNRHIDLTATDIRASMIKNYQQRLQTYGYISQYVTHTLDVSQEIHHVVRKKMDGIICDVPCSGSGTWARSPEQFYFFNAEKLTDFVTTQKNIIRNTLQQLRPQGKLYYITCSVFAAENEDILQALQSELSFTIVSKNELNAWERKGDALFLAEIIPNA